MDSSTSPVYHSRNVLHRRGSVSASDPFGIHAEQNLSDERALMSRLSIVRLAREDCDGHLFDSTPASPESRRSNSGPTSPSLHPRLGQVAQSRRLSFASSSFANDSLPPVASNPPPSYAIRKRRPSASLYAQRTTLTPQQICDLAQTSIQPRHLATSETIGLPSSPHGPTNFPGHSTSLTPVNFLPLSDGQFLPFLDRPAEVLEFISTSPTNRLLALLEQAFPPHLRRQRPSSEDAQSPPPSNKLNYSDSQPSTKQSYRHTPPQEWSYATLLDWMSTVSRSEVDDATWVRAIRTCVMARSEQICVTLLAALGVPMEGGADLDVVVSLPIGMPDTHSVLPELSTTFAGGFLPQLPTLSEVPLNDNEDAFQLEILPIAFESTDLVNKSDPQRYSPSGSTSSWSPSSRSSSRLSTTMESIGESDSEQDVEIHAKGAPLESEPRNIEKHLPGEVTVRAGSPVGAGTANASERKTAHEPLSAMTDQWDNENDQFPNEHHWRKAWQQVENCCGLSISTCARLAADPSLPSVDPHSAMPHAVASPVRPKQRRNTVQVSHVLSGAPGYAGFTWRPGGPLFPMSFTGATDGGEGFSTDLERGGHPDSFMTRFAPLCSCVLHVGLLIYAFVFVATLF
jgi:hypothetical protein